MSQNPGQSTWRRDFVGHLAKSSGQTLYLLKHQSQQPRKGTLTDTTLYSHQSSQNNSFSSLTVSTSEERSTSPPPSALSSAVWPAGVCGASKAMLPDTGAVLLPGQGEWEKADVAAGGRRILCADPQACPSPDTLLLLLELPFHTFSRPYSDVAL